MRISDWSSDVCSSDLDDHEYVNYFLEHGTDGVVLNISENGNGSREIKGSRLFDIIKRSISYGNALERSGRWGDRKSVGQGKSVSVRVDLGGRRTHKNKRKREQQRTKHAEKQHN